MKSRGVTDGPHKNTPVIFLKAARRVMGDKKRMYNIFYIIGIVVVVLLLISLIA